jgi:two-component system chemotaxis sensor kinase CheA
VADDEFLWEFLVESYENLDNIDSRLIALEANQDADAIAAIFRSMHTIKGTSGFFGFGLVERLGHVSENLLGMIRDGALSLTPERASALLAATDGLRALFAGIEATQAEPPYDIAPLTSRLESLMSDDAPAADAPTAEPAEAATVGQTDDVVVGEVIADEAAAEPVAAEAAEPVAAAPAKERRTRTRKKTATPKVVAATDLTVADQHGASDAGFDTEEHDEFVVAPTAELAAVGAGGPGAPIPNPPPLPDTNLGTSATDARDHVASATFASATSASGSTASGSTTTAASTPGAAGRAAPARPASDRTGDLLVAAGVLTHDDLKLALQIQGEGDKRTLGEILVAHGWADHAAVQAALTLQRQLRGQTDTKTSAEDSTIRLDVSVLDELMNLVGELVLARNSLVRSIGNVEDRSLLADSQRIDLVTSELQARVLRTRMRPIRTVWGKLPRLVREVSNACGKTVLLDLEGEDTELDKSVVEAIKDPLTHCVRNAVDHGIETPAERLAAGKRPEGRLHLRASHENGQVVIQIRDDGKGMDLNKIRAKALERGIHSEDSLSRMSEREVLDLIFAPGFSTAEKVTEVSGRGVGMDVVRTNVERIGGSVQVSTVLGEGTTFTFMIPLTLAIIPALLVSIGSHRYAIPQTSLVELVRLTGDDVDTSLENMHGLTVYRLRGRLLPIVDAASTLGVEHLPTRPGRKRMQIAVLQADGRPFGLVVDEIHGTEEIVVKPIGAHYANIGCFAGATILGDGVVSLILDVAGIADRTNVSIVQEADTAASLERAVFADDQARQYIIVSTADGDRHAVPLDRVARLEKFPRHVVEDVAGSRVVQYRDGLLPLTTIGPWPSSHHRSVVTVVLSSDLGEIGLVVEKVLDVHTGTQESASTITVTDGRAHEIVDVEQLTRSCRHLLAEAY